MGEPNKLSEFAQKRIDKIMSTNDKYMDLMYDNDIINPPKKLTRKSINTIQKIKKKPVYGIGDCEMCGASFEKASGIQIYCTKCRGVVRESKFKGTRLGRMSGIVSVDVDTNCGKSTERIHISEFHIKDATHTMLRSNKTGSMKDLYKIPCIPIGKAGNGKVKTIAFEARSDKTFRSIRYSMPHKIEEMCIKEHLMFEFEKEYTAIVDNVKTGLNTNGVVFNKDMQGFIKQVKNFIYYGNGFFRLVSLNSRVLLFHRSWLRGIKLISNTDDCVEENR